PPVLILPPSKDPTSRFAGREGFEPSTLGLRVRPNELAERGRTETACNSRGSSLQRHATRCSLRRQPRTRIRTRGRCPHRQSRLPPRDAPEVYGTALTPGCRRDGPTPGGR